MNSTEQAAGEKRVREQLVTPLLRCGLTKTSSLTKDQFEDMVQDLCARLGPRFPYAEFFCEQEKISLDCGV